MRATFTILVLATALHAAAQSAPASSVFDTQTVIAARPQRVVSFTPVKETGPKIFDRKFLVLAGIATAATMLDVTTTTHCMSKYAACQEGNPLLGSHPSQAKLYGVSFSMLGGNSLPAPGCEGKLRRGTCGWCPQSSPAPVMA